MMLHIKLLLEHGTVCRSAVIYHNNSFTQSFYADPGWHPCDNLDTFYDFPLDNTEYTKNNIAKFFSKVLNYSRAIKQRGGIRQDESR